MFYSRSVKASMINLIRKHYCEEEHSTLRRYIKMFSSTERVIFEIGCLTRSHRAVSACGLFTACTLRRTESIARTKGPAKE